MRLSRLGVGVLAATCALVASSAITWAASTSGSSTTTTAAPTTTTTAASTTSNLACAEQSVATWSVRQLANETISVSAEASDIAAMAPAARDGYGAILLFGTTAPAGFATTLASLQRKRPEQGAMLVMTDQEGGGVERLTNLIATLPWAQTMGKNLTAAQITAQGLRVGTSMRSAGINTDLAPVADVDGRAVEPGARDPDGFRSFSGVPAKTAADAVAFANGLREAQVLAVVKHFPGLGGATGNTDDSPAATLAWPTLQKTGLVPFRAAIRDGVRAIMVSNATVPGLTSLPASISPAAIGYLRDELGFSGLLVTDSLSAGAIGAIHLSVPAASVRALGAGADLVLAGTPASSAASLQLAGATSSAIQQAVARGTISLSTLRDAAAQVLASVNTVSCAATP